ncbi:MAG: hypothetical protein OXD01_11860 [Gammaproteobacteria bacterium]|nr:hypothetical protein [Gammaproteobacteria bacterium]
MRDTLPIASRFESGQMLRIDEPMYPPLATREALANALCHRDYAHGGGSIGLAIYDDRLEITSTGPLHFGIKPEDLYLPHDSNPWNPLIARTFYRRGVIEEWGSGTVKIANLTIAAGLPRPEIEERRNTVIVRFRPSQNIIKHEYPYVVLSELQKEILEALDSANSPLAPSEIVLQLSGKPSVRQVQYNLKILKDMGLVALIGQGRGSRWTNLQK